MKENKVTGKAYRILTDKANEVYDRISFWTKATDVEMNSGNNLQKELSELTYEIYEKMNNNIYDLQITLNSTITNRLSPLETQVNTNKTGIATLTNRLSTLETQVATNKTGIATLNAGLESVRSDLSWTMVAQQELGPNKADIYYSDKDNRDKLYLITARFKGNYEMVSLSSIVSKRDLTLDTLSGGASYIEPYHAYYNNVYRMGSFRLYNMNTRCYNRNPNDSIKAIIGATFEVNYFAKIVNSTDYESPVREPLTGGRASIYITYL